MEIFSEEDYFLLQKHSSPTVTRSRLRFFEILTLILGDGYDSIGSLQWRSSRSDLLQLCLRHFPTSHIKIIWMKNCPKFCQKLFVAVKLRKQTLCML